MQLVGSKSSQRLNEIGEGSVTLLPTDPEDMWHANNLIAPEDVVKAHAVRKVITESKTGTAHSERVHTDLTIRVTSTFFDTRASTLHVSGTVIVENSFVNLGQYHTLDLELNRPFTLWKKYGWDSVAQEALQDALKQDREGAVAAVVIDEKLANICLITEYRTILLQRVTSDGKGKTVWGAPKGTRTKGTNRFFDTTLSTLTRNIDFSIPRPLLLVGPGFAPADFKAYMSEEAARKGDKAMKAIVKDTTVIHSSSGQVQSLNEMLKSSEVMATMKELKSSRETQYLDELGERMRKDDGRAWYGVSTVEKAINEGAVGIGGGVLLVNNSLFRSMDIATRKKYVGMVDKVREAGGEARILSSDHESGQRLDQLGGIAAILTYPIFDLDVEEAENEETNGDAGEMIV